MRNIADISILIVDDEVDSLSAYSRFLHREPYKTYVASNGQQALELVKSMSFALVITDLRMPEMSGLELVQHLKTDNPEIIRFILSGTNDIGLIIDSINSGEVFRFISKPINPENFKRTIADGIEYYCLKAEREQLVNELENSNRLLSKTNETLQITTQELREREQQFRSMNDAAHDPIFMINEGGNISYANTAAEILFGFTKDEWPSIRFMELLTTAEKTLILTDLTGDDATVMTAGKELRPTYQVTALCKKGHTIPIELTTGKVALDGKPHSVIIARDITARIESEKAREHYETSQKELEAQIEKKLLQGKIPEVQNGISISRLMITSGHLDGDFTEILTYSERLFDVVVGDVMGHGIMSALTGAGLKSLVMKIAAQKNFQSENLASLQDIVTGVHEVIINELIDLNIYATAMFIRMDLEAGRITAVDCGHNPAIHFHVDTKDISFIKGDNLPIGLVDKTDYHEFSFPVQKGDFLVLFSDGLTESLSPDNDLFGIERLTKLIGNHHQEPPGIMVEKIYAAVCNFTGRNTFDDDLTCMIIRIENSP